VGQDKVNAERLDVYDANFIEHSREDVLALLDEVDRLNARLEFWWKQLDESSFNYICAAIAISRVKRACAEAEALHRKIWDEMDDYADIGQPKGPFPGNTQVSVEKILEALSGP
jgi:hypothetical protein